MKKIYLRRHVDLGEHGYFHAGDYTLSEADINRLDAKHARYDVIEDLTPKGESKGKPKLAQTPEIPAQVVEENKN